MSVAKAEPASRTRQKHHVLALCLGVSVILLGLGGWLTYLGLGPWYEQLRLPPFQPPSWVFTPMWTIVLTLLAVATWLVAREGERSDTSFAMALYGAQCVLNAAWSLLFFALERPDIALWELILLDVVMILMILAYGRTSPFAAALLLPYLAWLLLATAINFWIVQHNTIGGESSTTMTNQQVEHDVFMREAIEIAKENQAAPFGAVLVHRGRQEVAARGVNQAQRSPTLHGEIAAIQRYAELGGDQWNELTLYTTAEPCCMCQGAILWANIAEVVFGISIPELAQLGWKQIDISCSEVVARSWRPDASITGGVLLSECRELFRHATPWK